MGNRAPKDKRWLCLVGGIVSNFRFQIFIGEQSLLLQWGGYYMNVFLRASVCTTFYLTLMFKPFVSFESALVFFPSFLSTAPNSDPFVDWFNYYPETPYIFRLERNADSLTLAI